MALTDRSVGTSRIVEVAGEVDVHTCGQLHEHLLQVIDTADDDVLVDLTGVSFLDSSGLGALVGANKRLGAKGRRLGIVCADPKVLRLFTLTRLDEVLAIRPTVGDAESGA